MKLQVTERYVVYVTIAWTSARIAIRNTASTRSWQTVHIYPLRSFAPSRTLSVQCLWCVYIHVSYLLAGNVFDGLLPN